MQVPLLKTHRRDGLFLSIQQENSLSRPCVGHSTETPRPCPQLFEKVKPIRLNQTKIFPLHLSVSLRFNSADWKEGPQERREESERDSAWEQSRRSNKKCWETAIESGRQDIKGGRSSSSSSGGGCQLCSCLKKIIHKASQVIFQTSLPHVYGASLFPIHADY